MLQDILDEFGLVYVLAVASSLALAVVGLVAGWVSTSWAVAGIDIPGLVPVALFAGVGVLGVGAAVYKVVA